MDNLDYKKLDGSQTDAIRRANCARQFFIIHGNAGSGKTTIVKFLIEELRKVNTGQQIELVSFTGKAAARLQEATGYPASTIHRCLQSDGTVFRRGGLADVIIIVDEASMVTSHLMAELIKRKPQKLILVGDNAQLPPVGNGEPFHDIISIYPEKASKLAVNHRAKEAVYIAAQAIRNGEMPKLQDSSGDETWKILNTGNAEKTQKKIIEWVKKDFLDFSQDIILVCRNGEKGADGYPACTYNGLNIAIKDIVNPSQNGERLSPGDRIINTKNQPELNIWNGTTGVLKDFDIDGSVLFELDEDGRIVVVPSDMRKHLKLAYCLTVHKAQGSQYRKVIFVCLNRDSFSLIDRSLIYTAITRTQKDCLVVGEVPAFKRGITTVNEKDTIIKELSKEVVQ